MFDDTAPAGLPAMAAAVVAGLTGSIVRESERIHRGMMTFKCRVRTGSGDELMVRFYPATRSALVHQEPDLLARCRQAGLPVPVVIGDSRTGPPAPLAYVVYRRIAGETLTDRLPGLDGTQRARLAADLAMHLHRLKDVVFDGAGDLLSGSTGRDITWTQFVDRSLREGLEAIRRHGLLEDSLASALERVVRAGWPAHALVATRLVWGDINFENILVTDEATVAGLVDFEGCLSGDPLATLGYLGAVHGTDPFFGLLIRAWSMDRYPQDDVCIAWYALVRALRLARYAHLPLPTGRPRDPLIQIVPGIVPAISTLDAAGRPTL
ncbi:MAG: phosphotransferase [Pseudomonadota bacterium]|nr:phosphotransferase [Pseudomonadota bacterium]